MPETLEVRRYRPADRERVEVIMETALRDAGAYDEDAPEDLDGSLARAVLDGAGEFLVGEVDGTVVATGAFRPVEGIVATSLDTFGDDTGEIKRMHVLPDHQRSGYGQRLLDELERRALNRGYRELVLATSDRQTAACRFYESNGFEEILRHSIGAFDESFDMLVYRKPLSGSK